MSTAPLGDLRFSYEQQRKSGGKAGAYLAGATGAVTLLSGLCLGGLIGVWGLTAPDAEPVAAVVMLVLVLGAGLVFGGGLLGVAWWLKKRAAAASEASGSVRLEICDGGVRLIHPSGLSEETWATLSSFRSSPPHGRIYGLKVNSGYHFFALEIEGESLSVSKTPQLKEMGLFIEERLIQAQLPAAVRAVEAGETVRFGDVHVGPDGVTLKGLIASRFTWDEFKGLYLGRMARISAGTVRGPFYIETPNAPVLFHLVQQIQQRKLAEG